MKKLLFCYLVLIAFNGISQNMGRCGFLEAQDYLFKSDTTAKQRFESLMQQSEVETRSTNKMSSAPLYTIPVVFHILHNGGTENISDAQVLDALAILNRDFNKANADTSNIVGAFQNIAADCNIEFKLATLDEQSNCTSGITRHYDNNTNWAINSSSYQHTWNRNRYLNIYVVKSMPSGIAGYTYLPGTTSPQMDAIVILYNYVGSIGTASPYGSRSLTHEVGHWFNLQHVWGSTNQPGVSCGDDGVGDTPLTKGFSFCNLSNAAQCTPGVTENVQNYMEYAFCSVMFTQGQRNRMHNSLNSALAGRSNLSTPSNLAITGVVNPSGFCAPKAEFESNSKVTCVGNSLSFNDYSYNGVVTDWEWSSPSASNTSTLQNGILQFTQAGMASVKLKVSNAFGSDSLIKQELIVLAANGSGSLNLTQGFESGVIPDTLWLRSLPQFGGSFQTTTQSAKTGTSSLWLNNYFDNPSEAVSFFSPSFSFQSFSPALLSFYYAYTQKASTDHDAFKVYASTNCGASWNQLFSKTGSVLSTTGTYSNSAFYAAANDYKFETIDLSAFANQNLYLKFEFTPDETGSGNNIFIDDINISGLASLQERGLGTSEVLVYPNPFTSGFKLKGSQSKNISSIKVMDASSRLLPMEIKIDEHGDFVYLPKDDLANGLYFLILTDTETKRVLKLIKE